MLLYKISNTNKALTTFLNNITKPEYGMIYHNTVKFACRKGSLDRQ